MAIAASCGTEYSGIRATTAFTPLYANATPSAPPVTESITLSVSNCWMTRLRPAPSATRTAISPCRALARASRRFAMLAHAISSRKPTAASRAKSVLANFPRIPSLTDMNSVRKGGSG